MTINIDLLTRTLAHIEQHPEDWNQHTWGTRDELQLPPGNVCGTAMCFAGHAIMLGGGKLLWEKPYNCCPDRSVNLVGASDPTGDPEECGTVEDVAIRMLGLDYDQADLLFRGGNTLSDLKQIVAYLVEPAGVPS